MLANQLSQATAIIQHGGVIAYSTDTVLGLGCDPNHRNAVERILWLKQRGIEKGLILLVANANAMEKFSQPLSNEQRSTITAVSPTTPISWLVPARHSAPAWLTGEHDRVAMRISQHPLTNKLCESVGAIVSTSANFSNYPNADNAQQLRDWFGPYLDYVIIGEAGTGMPSEIRDLIYGKLLRKN